MNSSIVQQQPISTRRVHKASTSKHGEFMAIDPKDAFKMFDEDMIPGAEHIATSSKFRIQLCDQKQHLNYYRISSLQEEKLNVNVPKVDKTQIEKQKKQKERALKMRNMRKEAEKTATGSAFSNRTGSTHRVGANSVHESQGLHHRHGRDRNTLSRNRTVRFKILVRLRNLVVFEVFGVKFSAKKSIFQNCLSGSFYAAILKNPFFGRKFHSKNLKKDRISVPDQHF